MLKKLFIMLCLYLCCNMPAEGSQTQSQNIAVIKSYNLKMFDEIITEFKLTCRCSVTEHSLAEDGGQEILGKIRRTKPAAVFVLGAEAFSLVKRIRDIPVIYTYTMVAPDSEESNRIGVKIEIPPEKQFEELLKLLPDVKTVGVVYDPTKTSPIIRDSLKAAKKTGIKLVPHEVYSQKKVIAAISGMKDKIDVFWMLPDPTLLTQEAVEFLLFFSLENNIPIFTFSEKYVRLGALMSLSPDPLEVGKKTGGMARRILAGEDVSDIKADNVDRVLLSINTSAAKKLGITISEQTLNRANIVNKDTRNR